MEEIFSQGNSQGSRNPGADVCIFFFIQLGQTEVRNLGVEVFIEQNVGSFDISVNNLKSRLLVKVC